MSPQSPIFNRTYDLLRWLVPATVRFPRAQRFVMAEQLQVCAFEFQRELFDAAASDRPLNHLRRADASLNRLRMNLRLSHELSLLSVGQYSHVSKIADELGRLLGGWSRAVKRNDGVSDIS